MVATSEILSASRKAKRRKNINKIIFAFLGIVIFAGLITAFFYIPKLRINEISINGARFLDKEKLENETFSMLNEKFLKIIPCDNFLIFPKGRIISMLIEKFPVIKNIDIKRNFSRNFQVFVEERKPEAILCSLDNLCFFIDNNGFIFSEGPFFSGNVFLKFFGEKIEPISVGKQMVSSEEFRKLLSFKELAINKNFNILKIVLKENNIYEIYFDEGWYLIINNNNDPYSSLKNLELVLEANIKEKRQDLEYIDLRFGKKVYFKYR